MLGLGRKGGLCGGNDTEQDAGRVQTRETWRERQPLRLSSCWPWPWPWPRPAAAQPGERGAVGPHLPGPWFPPQERGCAQCRAVTRREMLLGVEERGGSHTRPSRAGLRDALTTWKEVGSGHG